ncbi:homoserine kinase [Acididesulfobacillus acetoxydans]|uniref:Homoserine kinase n=1 Tax=Acididesulfobacillus acetoxydans TaxID=1561005 RepID=A0A8S0X5H8_9FIRM|nr:homoserine kinase [Acididesulfobacillus acetoxydans]CAA7601660.1 homoserine kinase [Acididesulfobacillus acetoxydans]CEJ06326.1 Homoserine kinase [Acididesulfobacillus acetoxydans]
MSIRVSVPATSANLGPGFDSFGLALTLRNTLSLSFGHPFAIELAGRYSAGISRDETNLVWQTMLHLWQRVGFPVPRASLLLENNIPPARGLGSSSAAICAGLLAANAAAGSPFSRLELLQIAGGLEGHPDNVTPALFGGVTFSVQTPEGILPRIIAECPPLAAVVAVPDTPLKTETARAVLESKVPRADAVFNIGHAALIVEAFLRRDYPLLRPGMEDRLHQEQRAGLIPGLKPALEAALRAGAYGAALSGSGPTLLALADRAAAKGVGWAMQLALAEDGLPAEIFFLSIDPQGATVTGPDVRCRT